VCVTPDLHQVILCQSNKGNIIVLLAAALAVECGGYANAQVRIWGCAAWVCSFSARRDNSRVDDGQDIEGVRISNLHMQNFCLHIWPKKQELPTDLVFWLVLVGILPVFAILIPKENLVGTF
jgi:hypothetical protein